MAVDMSVRYFLIMAVILVMLAPAIPCANGQVIPHVVIAIDSKEMQDCFGINDDRAVVVINASPTVSLNHAMVFPGSGVDTLESERFRKIYRRSPGRLENGIQ